MAAPCEGGCQEVLSHHKGLKGQNAVLKRMLDVFKPSATFTSKQIKKWHLRSFILIKAGSSDWHFSLYSIRVCGNGVTTFGQVQAPV